MRRKGLGLRVLALVILALIAIEPLFALADEDVCAVEVEAPANEAGEMVLPGVASSVEVEAPVELSGSEAATEPAAEETQTAPEASDASENSTPSEEPTTSETSDASTTETTSPSETATASEQSETAPETELVPETKPEENAAAAPDDGPVIDEDEEYEGEELAEPSAVEFGPDESGRINRIFNSEVEVKSDTWSALNLKRATGYSGKLAYVAGKLELNDILIEGATASEVPLLDYFELAPEASIQIPAASDGLSIGVSAFSFNKGASKTLAIKWNGVSLSNKKAKWYTSDKNVVSVSSKGKVTAKGKGRAIITVKYSDATAYCSVDVTNIVVAKKIKLNYKKLEVALDGVDKSLKPVITPSDADVASVMWTSSAPSVATVDENGAITGISGGTAIVKATLPNGKSASCEVTVREIKPQSIDFEKLFITLHPGESYASEVSFTPAAVTFDGYVLSSDDPSVCTVTEDGLIVAKGVGNATVTVRSDKYPDVKNTCRVSVIRPDAARLEGLVIGINPGHQKKTIKTKYPLAPGSSKKAYGVKTGACGKYTKVNEYETTLAIGLKLMRILEEQGAKVVITRTSNDVMLTNIDRAEMLNDAGVDIALQLHCNTGSSSKHGNSGYIRTTGDWVEESREMAATLTAAISDACGCANLGVKIQNEYMSLNWTTTPSVLLEMGYISNRTEDYLLASDEYREQMAYGISEGIATYFGR